MIRTIAALWAIVVVAVLLFGVANQLYTWWILWRNKRRCETVIRDRYSKRTK